MGRYDAKTSLKGQATIPAEVRDLLGLRPGDTVQFITSAEGEVKVVAKRKGLELIKGLFASGEPVAELDEAIADAAVARNDPDRTDIDR